MVHLLPSPLLLALVLLLAQGQAGAQSSSEPSAEPPPSLEEQAPLMCWAGLRKAEEAHGLEGLRAAIHKAIARGDGTVLEYLRERLTELIGNDAAAAQQVLAWADHSPEPQLSLYMQALREAEAVRDPKVVSGLLKMAETHVDPGHQAMALVALETQQRLEAPVLGRLTELALRDKLETGVAMHAVRTIGRIMETDYRDNHVFEPYANRLLEVALEHPEQDVRSLAVEMGTYPEPRFDAQSLEKLAKLQASDPDPGVREMAALVMSSAKDPDEVLKYFKQSFPGEQDVCVRWAIFRYAARAAGPSSLPVLKEFAKADPRFQQDYEDFKAIYGSGVVDFERVWLSKKIHHPCELAEG